MKNFFNLSSVLATALMMTVVSCSSSDDITGGNGSGNAEGTTSYIAINLNSVGNAPTSRASYEQGGGKYDDGETNENKITSVRFYFYNADGTSYKLQTAGEKGSKNFIDLPVGDLNGGNHDNTVSGTTSAVLVLNGESNVAPATMLTVVNPNVNPDMFSGTTADRWSTMRTEMKGTKTFNDATNGFMMSNSTYEDGGKDLCTTQLTGKTFSSANDATNHPVEVFVERVNAKVKTTVDNANFVLENTDVELDGVNFNGKYKTKVPVGKLATIQPDGSTKETEVYAYIEGWGLGDEDEQAMLYKQIDAQNWTDATLGFSSANNPWSVAAYHRCFWGKSVAFGGTSSNSPVNHPYKEINAKLGTALYTLPNTPTTYEEGAFTDPMKSYLTKIMVAARLAYLDAAGTAHPAEICTYKGQKFLGKDNVKKVIASELNTYYKKNVSATTGEETYTQIEASDIDFSSEVTSTSELKLQNYQVVADLKGLTELYQKKGGNFERVEVAKVKAEMQQAPVDISNGGRTYYYTPIKHLGKVDSPAEYGVVRNHSYQVEISSIKGFGTPVYDPDSEKIIPTLPSDDKTYLAAKISVLSWRVVSDKVNLDKTE